MPYTPQISIFVYEHPMLVLIYAVAVNVLACLLFGIDKRNAISRKRRIPEGILLLLTIIGGGLGALTGMYLFSHKTNHSAFLVVVPFSFLVWTLLLLLALVGVI